MPTYTITLTDLQDQGVAAALAARNAAMPQTITQGEGDAAKEAPNPDLIPDAAAYVQSIMAGAADSYVVQHKVEQAASKQVISDFFDQAAAAGVAGADEAKAAAVAVGALDAPADASADVIASVEG